MCNPEDSMPNYVQVFVSRAYKWKLKHRTNFHLHYFYSATLQIKVENTEKEEENTTLCVLGLVSSFSGRCFGKAIRMPLEWLHIMIAYQFHTSPRHLNSASITCTPQGMAGNESRICVSATSPWETWAEFLAPDFNLAQLLAVGDIAEWITMFKDCLSFCISPTK